MYYGRPWMDASTGIRPSGRGTGMSKPGSHVSIIQIENQWLKFAVDQPLHALWGGVPWWITAASANLALTFHQEGLTSPLGLKFAVIFSIQATLWLTTAFIIREVKQWPSKRWWDPPADWFFFALGTGLGIWLGLR